jgi:threonyl-tRNA synthetase
MENNAYKQLIDFLDANKASYRQITHTAEGRTDIVSGMRGNALAAAAKCIVVMVKLSKKEKVFVLAVVPGDAKVDLNKIKATLSGEYVSFASQDIAEKLTGAVAGTILPFSFNPELRVWVDPRMLGHDEIFFNAALLDTSLALRGADYARLHGGQVIEIAKYDAVAPAAPSVESSIVNQPALSGANGKSAIASEQTSSSDTPPVMYGKDKNIPEGLYKRRHSLAHVMAQAVIELFPEAKPTIGPPIENGFYYDFGMPKGFTPDDLAKIEARMRDIVKKGVSFERREVSAAEARATFKGNEFKLELIDGLAQGGDDMGEAIQSSIVNPQSSISFYTQDGFTDLCRGPHVANTREIDPDAFKLSTSSSAYWRGNEKNPVLQRIYGLAFDTPQQLADYVHMQEEAKKRDHRKLGAELEIFLFDDEVGPGLPLWQPNGAVMIEQLEALAKKMEQDGGYDRVKTPHLTKENLFIRSGHLPYYAEGMFPPMELDDGIKYYLKPMNCPFHHKIYAAKPRSYRDLPIRYAEYGTCYRFEQSGELFGLMRVRSLQMNDAHIYVTEEQFESEFMAVIQMYLRYFEILGVDKYKMRLSLHSPEGLGKKYVNNPELWLKTEEMVRRAMTNGNVPFFERENEAAFYGPKIDVQIYSAIGREFSLATNQVDFAVPPRFNLTYVDKDGQEKTPLCLHRAPLSTHERLIGFLIEHFAGNFPLWLAPVQAQVIPIADRHVEYCRKVAAELTAAGLRVKVDDGQERMQKKILNAQQMKIPYMLVVGDKEQEAGAVAVRLRSGEDLKAMPLAGFKARALDLVARYAREL